jgi:hypothetical protein
VNSDSEREIGRAILGALDMYWSEREDTPAGTAADKLIVKTLTPFGAWAATLAIEKHRAAAPRHHREPDCAALAEMARAIGQTAQGKRHTGETGGGTWRPPAGPTPEQLERERAAMRWASELTDEQHDRLRDAAEGGAVFFFPRSWRGEDMRTSAARVALLRMAAQRTEPELLPLMLREDIDTIEKNKARRTA